MSEYLLQRRAAKLGLTAPKSKEVKPIAKRSEKMKKEMKSYIPAAKAFLAKEENQLCHIRFKGCTDLAECIHHAAGRTGSKLHDQQDWIPSCTHCNLAVEIFDSEAREQGFKKSRLNKAI